MPTARSGECSTFYPVEITGPFLVSLRDDLVSRRIGAGIRTLEDARVLIEALDPAQPNAAAFLGLFAQWVDVGFGTHQQVKDLLDRFAPAQRSRLTLRDYGHLRMAQGLIEMYEERTAIAVEHFRFVLSIGEDLDDRSMVTITHFWIGRCFRKSGTYDEATHACQRAIEIARQMNHPKMVAIMQVMESWLLFQKGRSAEAVRILKDAEEALRETDDFISLGNIHSAYGRIARRDGKYDLAIEHGARAVGEYSKHHSQHRNLARSLANMAFVERLSALALRRKIDRDAARRARIRSSAQQQQRDDMRVPPGETKPANQVGRKAADLARLEELRENALSHLADAQSIYNRFHYFRGEGNVRSIRGALYLDSGELDLAEIEAKEAQRMGEAKQDLILMARGRIQQCQIENARVEEGIEDPTDPGRHARHARQCAQEAIAYAEQTENLRLQARARIWFGLTVSNDFFDEKELARQYLDRAAQTIKPDGHDYIWDDLQTLRNRVLGAGSVDAKLRLWSQGVTSGKTFQELEEEFAEFLIPKVWELEDRKVSRVADKLKVSPKKVRRVLSHLGLLQSKEEPADEVDADSA